MINAKAQHVPKKVVKPMVADDGETRLWIKCVRFTGSSTNKKAHVLQKDYIHKAGMKCFNNDKQCKYVKCHLLRAYRPEVSKTPRLCVPEAKDKMGKRQDSMWFPL